jgi:nucleoside-diphosphate-sugar epimerase
MRKILITGALGQIGSELGPALGKKYGDENIIASDIKPKPDGYNGVYEELDVTNLINCKTVVKKYSITEIYHLASLLSATGEKNPDLAWKVNMEGLKNILDLAKENSLKVFWPSSIAAFGPTTPRVNTPQRTIMEPTTMYGVTKYSGELLCQYYYLKYKVDVRSVRYPGLISWKTPPGGGTTDYAVAIFYEGVKIGKYECFVSEDTMLPMMYMDDAVRATLELMEAIESKIKIRTSYNLAGISFSAKELADEINKHIKVKVTYKDRKSVV